MDIQELIKILKEEEVGFIPMMKKIPHTYGFICAPLMITSMIMTIIIMTRIMTYYSGYLNALWYLLLIALNVAVARDGNHPNNV